MWQDRVFSPHDCFQLGARLGRCAQEGTVVALTGGLGVGKTLFARGVGQGLVVSSQVCSPTFVLAMVHEGGRLPLAHLDLYRLCNLDEAEAVGLPELLASPGVVLVEWADQVPELLPVDHLHIELRWIPGHPQQRDLIVQATGPRHRPLEVSLHGQQ